MKSKALILLAATAILSLTACNHLSRDAKKIVGNYYISEISEDVPLMELNADGTCLMRAIKPGVLTYAVGGRWNVVRDSLIFENTRGIVETEGDTTLIGNVPDRMAKAVVDFSGITLTLRADSTEYVYHRRGINKKK